MENKKHNYIFGDFLGNAMSKVTMQVQIEASMMSMSLMMVGMVLTISYFVMYGNFPTWFKIMLIINGLCGIIFMLSYLVTSFQQYRSYMEAQEFFNQNQKGGEA